MVKMKGISTTRSLIQGAPQEGILFPLVWNLAFDEFLDRFNSGLAHIRGFAIDSAVVLQGSDICTLIEWGQEAISRALEFGGENGLEFWANKTKAVVFTHERLKTTDLPRLHMGNRDLTY